MSRSNWLYYVALGLSLCLAPAALGQVENYKDVEAANQKPEDPAQEGKTPAPAVTSPPPAISGSASVYQANCDSPKSRDEADLCEQRRMADAAVETVNWTRATAQWAKNQFYATIGEIVALVVTIAVAIAAVAAAFKSNGIARKSAERQLRAYIGVIEGRAEWVGDRPLAKLTIKNAGATPAYGVTNKINGSYGEPGEFSFDEDDDYFPRFDFLPGDTITITHEFTEPLGWDAFLQTGRKLYLWGQLSFTDAFGEPRTVDFRYRTGERIEGNVFSLAPTPEGNESN